MKRVMGKNKNYVVGIYDDTRMSHNLWGFGTYHLFTALFVFVV